MEGDIIEGINENLVFIEGDIMLESTPANESFHTSNVVSGPPLVVHVTPSSGGGFFVMWLILPPPIIVSLG